MDRRGWEIVRERYGQRVTLRRGEEAVQVRAFFQPVAEKTVGEVPTALGRAPVGKWLYLGPCSEGLDDVDELEWAGRSFRILRWREEPLGPETLFFWAVAEEMDKERGT